MTKKEVIILADRVECEFLPFVRKPPRYIGGEINQVKKDLTACELTVALCFPDLYEVAMSNLGLAIIYEILNSADGIAAERVFSPWTDAEEVLRKKNIPLFTLESKAALKTFDVIGFSLTTELCYTNVLNILDLAGLNIKSYDRAEDDPIIIAGGGMANCCEPIADFIDLFLIGDGENAALELAEFLKDAKKSDKPKKQILLDAARRFPWAYVPSLYNVECAGTEIKSIQPAAADLPPKIENAVVKDFENAPVPQKPIVPFVQAVHERVCVEIMRGCPGRCLFCQASFTKRPVRYRTLEKIIRIAKAAYHATGFDTVSLLSLSSADYPHLEQLVAQLNEYFCPRHVGLSLPSLRVDQQLKILPQLITSVRKPGLTIAVEAATERLRNIVNKPLKDCDLFAAAEAAYRAGWQKIKLYFMVGLPGETQEDIKKIVHLARDLALLRKQIDNRIAQINIAVSWFVPKPHTPLSWLGQKPKAYFQNAKQLILDEKKNLRAEFLRFKFHDIDCSVLESAIGRGDRRLAPVIEAAWKAGARFDLWKECFNNDLWQNAFEQIGFNLDDAAQKQFSTDATLPWDHLGGPQKKHLLKHLEKAMKLY